MAKQTIANDNSRANKGSIRQSVVGSMMKNSMLKTHQKNTINRSSLMNKQNSQNKMDGNYNSHSLNDDKESFKFPMLSKNSGKNKKSAYEKKSGMSSGGKSGMSFD